tara:strand:+ start:1170 stop:3482 length:2313 start_codon:yes stop_codon:yes gene_type:complete
MRAITKKSWPWTGSSDSEMGNTLSDVTIDSNVPDGLSPYEARGSFSEGKISPVDDALSSYVEDQDSIDEKSELLSRITYILNKNSSILNINGNEKTILKKGFDIVNIDGESDKDLRYYNFNKKFDLIHIFNYKNDNNLFFKNIYSQMKPISYGAIYIGSGDSAKVAEERITSAGFHIIKNSSIFIKKENKAYLEIIFKKNELDKVACVTIYSNFSDDICPVSLKSIDGSENSYEYKSRVYRFSSQGNLDRFRENPEFYLNNKVSFVCDVAYSPIEKSSGLQPYYKLNYGSGLLFKYDKPTDVVYHMGSVRFPIDIIFIDNDNKIKKIYKNIKPGSVATFGCASVKNVLEIPGGVSNHLGIYEGKFADINFGSISSGHDKGLDFMLDSSIENDIKTFAKISSAYNFNSYNYKDSRIISLGPNDSSGIRKYASNRPISSLYAIKNRYKDVSIFDLDSIGLNEPKNTIRLYSEKDPIRFIDVGIGSLLSSKTLGLDYKVVKGYKKSFYNFISNEGILSNDDNKFLSEIIKKSNNPRTKIIFATRMRYENDIVGEIISKKIEDQYGITALSIDYDIVTIDDDMSSGDLMSMVGQKYGFTSPTLYVSKMAGTPVPGNTKKVGESCISNIDKIISYLDLIKNNFEHNVSEYEKIQSDPDLVRRSKGLYNQSSNKSKESVEKSLKTILVVLKSMDSIKDISTTTELIDSVAASTKIYIEYVQNVFDLIEKFDDINFFSILSENTSAALSSISDCREALSRMKNYIYNDIMGVVPLSE